MSRKISKELAEIVEDVSSDLDVEIYKDYSGRGMYGSLCWGLVCSCNVAEAVGRIMYALCENDMNLADEFLQIIRETSSDSLGYNTIVYFPYSQWCDEDEGESESNSDC